MLHLWWLRVKKQKVAVVGMGGWVSLPTGGVEGPVLESFSLLQPPPQV